jgi:predicted transcriptional regulator
MTTKALKDVMQRVESWPDSAQEELAEIAKEIEAEMSGGVYHATPAELAGIDRGLKDAREGRFATDAQVKAVLSKYRGT